MNGYDWADELHKVFGLKDLVERRKKSKETFAFLLDYLSRAGMGHLAISYDEYKWGVRKGMKWV